LLMERSRLHKLPRIKALRGPFPIRARTRPRLKSVNRHGIKTPFSG